MSDEIRFTTDKSKIDIDFVTGFLSQESYWARGRSRETVESSIKNSFCMGMFFGSNQIGFARVVTDYETFAYIMDVFISPDYRNNGYGKQLMETLLGQKELSRLSKFHLKTVEAQEFYESIGFSKVETGFMQFEAI